MVRLVNRLSASAFRRLVVSAALFSPFALSIAAADQVKLMNGQTIRGTLLQYDERGIVLRIDSGRTLEYPLSKVESVDAEFHPAYDEAERARKERRHTEAIRQYRLALAQENRDWALSRIRSGLVRTLAADSQWAQAGRLFLELADERTDAEFMTLAPLVWTAEQEMDDQAAAIAQEWLRDSRPVARLIAGSWLLNSESPGPARAALNELATDPQQRVGWLARAQLWRIEPSTDAEEIGRFASLIEKMPEQIRGGPQYLLGQAYHRSGKFTDAALAYLWVAFIYAPETELAAVATLKAAEASKQAGMTDDAKRLFEEVLEMRPDTALAEAARQQLSLIGK